MTNFTPTAEQQDVIDLGTQSRESFAIIARAGAAKTTTLELLAQQLPSSEPTLALAFNKSIAKEMQARFPSFIDVRTMNGLGHRAWGSTIRKKLALDTKGEKLKRLINTELETLAGGDADALRELESVAWRPTRQLVEAARNSGLVPRESPIRASRALLPDTDESWDYLIADIDCDMDEATIISLARRVLAASIAEAFAGIIDFTDQIYMPTLFGGNFKRYATVMVDEAQDLSPINHVMIELSMRLVGPARVRSRLIAVGDPFQSIYGFRGAMAGSMDALISKYALRTLPLTTTFRCAKSIVAEAQFRAPDLRAADFAPEGVVETVAEQYDASLFPFKCAILCRNNAPLVTMALRLIRANRGVTLMGGNLFSELSSIINKVCPDPKIAISVAFARLDSWRSKEVARLHKLGRDELIAKREDQFACITALAEGVTDEQPSVASLLAALSDLESRAGEILLATGHKSKGLEWDEVFILDRHRIPSKYARRALEAGNPEQMEQERNLLYVMQTRARKRLVYITLDDMAAEPVIVATPTEPDLDLNDLGLDSDPIFPENQ